MMDAAMRGEKSHRDRYLDRLRKKSPNKKFEDDDEIFSQANEDYDNYERELSAYKDEEKALSEMFAADPRNAQFLADMHNGIDPVVGLVQRYGVEIRDVLDDPSMQEKLAEANREYVERVAKSKALDEEYEQNMGATLDTLRAFQEERGLSDAEIDAVAAYALGIVRDGVKGIFKYDTLEMMLNGMRHDEDVQNAGEEGRVAGRNDKIVEQLRKADKGDGTRPLPGKNGRTSGGRSGQSLFELASEAM